MTVRAAGGRRTGCTTPSRCEQQQQQQQYSSSQASIGPVVGCDRVLCGVVRDAVGFKKFFDRAIRSGHPVEKVDFLDGMCGSDCSIGKLGSKRHLFGCIRLPDLISDRKSPFSIHRSDCIRIGLKAKPKHQRTDLRVLGVKRRWSTNAGYA